MDTDFKQTFHRRKQIAPCITFRSMYFEFSDLIRLETIRTISSSRRNFALIKCSIIQYTSFHSFKFEFFQLGKLSNDENKLFYVIYYVYTFHSHPLQITLILKKFSNRQITPRLNLLHSTYALEFESFVSRIQISRNILLSSSNLRWMNEHFQPDDRKDKAG